MSITEKLKVPFPADCDIWPWAKTGNGYGAKWYQGKQHATHRLAYQLFVGEIPTGVQVCHTCDTPLCINPAHLFLGTVKQNAEDRNNKQRQAHGERNAGAKLTIGQVAEIRASDFGGERLAQKYGVHRSTIHRIRSTRTWALLSN